MDNTVFLDCLDREIHVGDVVAYGNRDGNYGSITPGVVTGFKDNKILATKYIRSRWRRDEPWRLLEGYWTNGQQCFITGMTEADLRQAAKIEESEAPQCVSLD